MGMPTLTVADLLHGAAVKLPPTAIEPMRRGADKSGTQRPMTENTRFYGLEY